ncbi:uncharacterized protein METZ01_LOCUS234675 [marine metagenome]|uniref:Uncharacterized protein n=1 Tax=marine metagenome TaxID=408172 RepID=A0A382H5X0_9ZZZZ
MKPRRFIDIFLIRQITVRTNTTLAPLFTTNRSAKNGCAIIYTVEGKRLLFRSKYTRN